MVLCIEADGAVSIESPHEQQICHARQERVDDSLSSGRRLASRAGLACVDIPLSLLKAQYPVRVGSSTVRQLARASDCLLPLKLDAPTADLSHALWASRVADVCRPPRSALSDLRSVVLVI